MGAEPGRVAAARGGVVREPAKEAREGGLVILPEPLPPSKARSMVAQAIRKGALVRPPRCERCPATEKIQGHHPDYREPLNCLWLCPACHAREHMRLRGERFELAAPSAKQAFPAWGTPEYEELLYSGFTPEQVAWLKEKALREAMYMDGWRNRWRRGEVPEEEVFAIELMLLTPQHFSFEVMREAAAGCFPAGFA